MMSAIMMELFHQVLQGNQLAAKRILHPKEPLWFRD